MLEKSEYDSYFVRNGALFKEVMGRELLVLPKGMQKDVIRKTHEENGHFGWRKMKDLLEQQYYIPNMRRLVEKQLLNCIPCILAERKQGKQEGFLDPIDKGEMPLDT